MGFHYSDDIADIVDNFALLMMDTPTVDIVVVAVVAVGILAD